MSVLLAATIIVGCIRVYNPEVQQGNVVTQEMIDQLKLGMTRRQVRFVMGTPLVVDPFHQDRWDYYFFRKRGKRAIEQRRISLFFEDDRLIEIRGDVRPKQGQPSGSAPI
ncbi:MAG: outer membrane protein assembly factor BamE [Acidiferrobacterales bacterium]